MHYINLQRVGLLLYPDWTSTSDELPKVYSCTIPSTILETRLHQSLCYVSVFYGTLTRI